MRSSSDFSKNTVSYPGPFSDVHADLSCLGSLFREDKKSLKLELHLASIAKSCIEEYDYQK